MRIDLHCDGVEAPPALRDYVARRMRFAIGRFRDHIQWARVKVADVNGPKGGADKRCVVQLRLRNLPDVVFAITQLEVRAAVDEAADRVARFFIARLLIVCSAGSLNFGSDLLTPAERIALDMIAFSPRRVTLPPNQPQVIRVGVRVPEGMPPGEYRAHMLFRAVPDAAPAAGSTTNSVIVFQAPHSPHCPCHLLEEAPQSVQT